MSRQRIDKWLWFARIVKTRTLAAAIVSQGQVRLNKIKVVKPAQEVGPGDIITFAAHGRVRVLKILGIAQRRGPPSEAQALYEDMAAPDGAEKLPH